MLASAAMKTTSLGVWLLAALTLSVACSDDGTSTGSGDAGVQDAMADVDLDAIDEAARALYQANAQRAIEEAGLTAQRQLDFPNWRQLHRPIGSCRL